MNRLQNLQIAMMAYKEISSVIEKWERSGVAGVDLIIRAHWDGCITVNDDLFHERELIKVKD